MSNELNSLSILKNAIKATNTTDTAVNALLGDVEMIDTSHLALTSLISEAKHEDDSPEIVAQAFSQLVEEAKAWHKKISEMSKSDKLQIVEGALRGAREADAKLLLEKDQSLTQSFTQNKVNVSEQLLRSTEVAPVEQEAATKSPVELCKELIEACRERLMPQLKEEEEARARVESLMEKPLDSKAKERLDLLAERQASRARKEAKLKRKRSEERAIGDAAQVAFIQLTQVSVCHALKKETPLHQVASELLDLKEELDLPIELDRFESEFKKAMTNYAEVAYEAGDKRMTDRISALRKAVENCGESLAVVRTDIGELRCLSNDSSLEAMIESNELSSLMRGFFV